MCGLAAIFGYGSPSPLVNPDELAAIQGAMYTRGPDGGGLWISESQQIGLAHRRLAILDLSDAGAQPMATPDGAVRISFNGEIYNFHELRRTLKAKGYEFRSNSDTEVLLYLYLEHGQDLVHHLRGMYAFALWDERKRGLLLARDPFGIKPLYYADDGRTIRVASQVKALLKSRHINTTPDPAGHVGFFLWGHVPEPYTLHQGIRTLPAGSTLWVDSTHPPRTRQFFNLTHELAQASDSASPDSHEEMLEQLHAALADSVKHHLIADVPVGLFLSAGIDSTTLLALTQEAGANDLHTVTLGFKEFQGTENDEAPLAELVAKQYGTTHQTRWVSKEEFQSEVPQLLNAMDLPSTDGVNSYFVSKVARESGLKVALSGLGGDEFFGGYPSFQQVPRLTNTFSAFNSLPYLGKGFRYVSAPILKYFTSPKYAGLLEYGGTFGGAYLLRRSLYMPWELPSVLDGEIVRKGWDELKTLSLLEQTTQELGNPHLKVMALETAWYMRSRLLRDSDWASMAHSLEVRLPLVDLNLLRCMMPLLKSRFTPTKQDLARSPKHSLPTSVLNRSKTGFSVPVREWLMESSQIITADRGLRGWAKFVRKHYCE